MKAFVHLHFLTFLFVISATGQSDPTATASVTAPSSTTATITPLPTSTATATPSSPPLGSTATATPSSPPPGSTATATPSSPPPGSTATATPSSPPPGSTATATPSSPPPGSTATATPSSPPPGSTATATPSSPPPGSTATATPSSPPPGSTATATPSSPPPGSTTTATPSSPPSGSTASPQATTPKTTETSSKASTSTRNTNTGPTDSTRPCQNTSCGGGSSCIALHNTSFCLCLDGYYYNASTCMKGKVFPGIIQVAESETADLEDKNSMAYQNLHNKINDFFQEVFTNSTGDSDYGQTVIDKVSTSLSARSGIRADKTVEVSVVNIFVETTKNDKDSVSTLITKALENGKSGIVNYTAQSLCEYRGCKTNTGDDCSDGLQCECKDGLQRPNPQVPFCLRLLSTCPSNCNKTYNKQCLQKDDGSSFNCVCLPGYQDKDGTCEKCPFGYSGVDCKDQFQLILTIVGTIAGILILSMMAAFIVSSRSKNKKKNTEEKSLIENSFQSLQLQPTGVTNFGADGSIFPKIRVAAPRDSQPQNPYVNPKEW